MQRINWRQHFLKHPQHLISTRIYVGEQRGVVRYQGHLIHQGKPANSENQFWVGIQWDNEKRGKNNGTVNGYEYFKTKNNLTSGSLFKYQKLEFGQSLFYAFLTKYFKKQDQIKKIQQFYKHIQKLKQQGNIQKIIQLKKDQPKIEYDNDAFFQTTLHKKRLVQFIGFDRIWQKIQNPQIIKEISLAHLKICHIGQSGQLSKVFPNLRVLSLEDNLLSSWHQVFLLGKQLPFLAELSLNNNKLNDLQTTINQQTKIQILPSKKQIDISPVNLFKNLHTLVLMEMGLQWQNLFKVIRAYPNLQQLILCKNNLKDWSFIQKPIIQNNIDQTQLQDIGYLQPFSCLPIHKLMLNHNKLKDLQKIPIFNQLNYLSIDYNFIQDPIAISRISKMKSLTVLSLRHNPMIIKLGSGYIRQRAIAQLPRLLVMNGSDLDRFQRKDSQIFYMKKSFQQYFAMKGVKCYQYDVQDFNKYREQHHPNLQRLIQLYSNPYPCQTKEIVKLIKQQQKQLNASKPTGMALVDVQFRQVKSQVRIPVTWKVSSTRNYFAKSHKIPGSRLRIWMKRNEEQDWIQPQDHKQMFFYGLQNGSLIKIQYLQ